MPDCVCLPECPFFHDKLANMPAMADIMKKRYCQGDWATCARHRVFEVLGQEAVPDDLFPNQMEDAEKILAAAKG